MTPRPLFITLALALLLAVPAAADASTGRIATPGVRIDNASPTQTLAKAKAARAGRGPSDSVTPLLKQLALKLPALRGSDRRAALRLLARPTQGQGASGELEYDVPEQKPICTAHFCVHWVDRTDDAPPLADSNGNGVPDYVDTMSGVFEHVYEVENTQLGWQAPKPDGDEGCINGGPTDCKNKTDVYIKEIGDQGIYGYAAPDPEQNSFQQHAYLVLDNDYSAEEFERYAGNALPPMEVTAAHEYNHVLQFGYDTAQDTWMFESTATYFEDRVYTDVNDYIQYLTPWAQWTFVPLTQFNLADGSDPFNAKVYGDVVWNRWIETKFGADTIRAAWASSLKTSPKHFAPAAYDSALRAKGSDFYHSFAQFATDTAEWRTSNSPFAEGSTFPDVDRATFDEAGHRPVVLTPEEHGGAGTLFHTGYVLLGVEPDPGMSQLKLAVNTQRGARMAIALVGRVGDVTSGTAETFVKLLPHGGPGVVTVDNPDRFKRLTAVVINADARATRFSNTLGDWIWEKDDQAFNARVSGDFIAPKLRGRSPAPGARRASTRSRVRVRFSERVLELTTHTVRLVGPDGHGVKAKLKLTTKGRKARSISGADTALLTPTKRLKPGKRYTVRLSRDLRDWGGNALPRAGLTWAFRTKR
jgi:hypothetical protein